MHESDERYKLIDYRLSEIEKDLSETRTELKQLDAVFVRLDNYLKDKEKYDMYGKAVIAIYTVLSLSAFGLMWKFASGS